MARYIKSGTVVRVPQINSELESIAEAISDTLSRKGDSPNQMEALLDMNANRIINLPAPSSAGEPLRTGDIADYISGIISGIEDDFEDEVTTLTDGQQTVALSVLNADNVDVFVTGSEVDSGPVEDFTIVGGEIVLPRTYPAGTKIVAREKRKSLIFGTPSVLDYSPIYATTESLKDLEDVGNLSEGTVVQTAGCASPNDGGSDLWIKTSDTDTASQSWTDLNRVAFTDTSGNVWVPVTVQTVGAINLQSIGGIGNGIADNTDILNVIGADTDVTCLVVPPGQFVYTSDISVAPRPFRVEGVNFEASELIPTGSATFKYEGGSLTLYEVVPFQINNVGFRQSGTNTGAVLEVEFSNTTGIPSTTSVIQDTEVTGLGSSDTFQTAILLTNPKNVRIENVRIMGDRVSSPVSQYGIRLVGEDNPAEIFIEKTTIYYVQDGLSVGGKVEGVYVNLCAFVAVNSGINLDTSTTIEPLLVVSDSHINARSIGIAMTDSVQFSIHDNLIYGSDGASFTGIYYRLNVNSYSMGKICNNHIENVSIVSTFNAISINSTLGTTSFLIDGNTFRNITTGTAIVLGASSSDVIVTPENYYVNVTNKINDAGSNYVNLVPRVSFSVDIDDDDVLVYEPKFASGMLSVHADGYNNVFSKCYFNTASSVTTQAYAGTLASFATGALTGTTGTAGDVTVSADGVGNVYIENRTGATRTFNLIFELSGA